MIRLKAAITVKHQYNLYFYFRVNNIQLDINNYFSRIWALCYTPIGMYAKLALRGTRVMLESLRPKCKIYRYIHVQHFLKLVISCFTSYHNLN